MEENVWFEHSINLYGDWGAYRTKGTARALCFCLSSWSPGGGRRRCICTARRGQEWGWTTARRSCSTWCTTAVMENRWQRGSFTLHITCVQNRATYTNIPWNLPIAHTLNCAGANSHYVQTKSYGNTPRHTVWMHACTHTEKSEGISALKFTAGTNTHYISIQLCISLGHWPLHALTHRLLSIKESQEDVRRERNKEEGDGAAARLTSHHDLVWFQHIAGHAGVHIRMHNRGRNAVCLNLPRTHLSGWTGANNNSLLDLRSIFMCWTYFQICLLFKKKL